MVTKNINFICGEEILSGRLTLVNEAEKPRILFLHGAGTSNKERYQSLTEIIANKTGIGSFSFDFSGQGESTGDMKEANLKRRIEEAMMALEFLNKNEPLTVVGASMGGHVALELANHVPNIKNLILLCPAVYSRDAINLPFNEQFSEIIRKERSWGNSPVLEELFNYTGRILIVIGADDTVIPSGVIDLIQQKASNAVQIDILRLPGVTHQLMKAINSDPSLLSLVVNKITELVENSN